ncbi:MAG: 2-hydroxyhepta-2,4-diene-1,7-dioate isomerase [Bacteroidetes bacterium 37-13]|nr:MAG: 2-hydroxyhepta-2,4-diene-1,7-dioate isomerase [Bacteroidetes bacterium 37-13]
MKIICIGRNYVDHIHELQNAIPENPVIFMKPNTAILKDNKPFFYPEWSSEIHYETELVLKISKQGKYIQEKFAHKYYQEIGLGIDFTARDLQNNLKAKGLPWEIAKAFDSSAVVGNFVDKAKLSSPILFHLLLNGNKVQTGNSSLMLYSFDKIISYISQFFTLQLGDLIYTGTPAGVGKIAIGDKLEGFLEEQKMFECEIK